MRTLRLAVGDLGDVAAVDAHVAQLTVGVAGELGEHGTELAMLGPDAQGMVEDVHGFGLQQNRLCRALVPTEAGRGSAATDAAIPPLIRPAFDVGRSSQQVWRTAYMRHVSYCSAAMQNSMKENTKRYASSFMRVRRKS